MKKNYFKLMLFASGFMAGLLSMNAQTGCAISNTTGLHGYGCGVGDQIDTYTLNGIAASNAGCATNAYIHYTSPIWNLTIGQTYTWAATTGNGVYDQGLAIWIDLNGDNTFTSNEQLANSNFSLTHSGSFMIPFSATPGSNVRMRLRCDYYTNIANTNTTACEQYGPPNYNFYYGETEDYYVNLISPTPCTATPAANNVVTPTVGICPGEQAFVSLGTTYTVGDITYQWYSSTTSSVGPFVPVPGGTGNSLVTPTLSQNVWYQTVITCTNTGGSVTATPGLVMVQGTTTNSVPYHEGFEGITADNKLPNCSWTAANIGSTELTYISSNTQGRFPHSGSKFASFYYAPGGVKTFYGNGIQLYAGVTYSAGLWWQTDYYGYNNWTDLSLLLGPTQSATGQQTVATTNGPAVSNTYKLLSNTFTVAASGIYYPAVRATNNTNSYAYYLSWDDLFIEIPCELNTPMLSVTPNQTVCAGDNVNISASGADLYQWSHGPTSAVLVENPLTTTIYSVTGTNSLTGCSATQAHVVTVNPTPEVGIFATKYAICEGENVSLTAFGADMYMWTNNANTPVNVVNPQVTTTYSVVGTNVFGCQASAAVQITVHPSASIMANVDRPTICVGESATLTAQGGVSYQFVSPGGFQTSNPAIISPVVSTNYTVTGTDANGCKGVQIVGVSVEQCVGLSELTGTTVKVFPNPNTGEFVVTAPGKTSVIITDLTGRHVSTFDGTDRLAIDISGLANGVYYVKVRTEEGSSVVRIVKE